MQDTLVAPTGTERIPPLLETIINSDPYGVGISAAANLARLGQEASNEVVRSARFAQASYHRMLDVARQLRVPLDRKDILNSAGMYRYAEGCDNERLRASKFSEATYMLGNAVLEYLSQSPSQ